MYIEIKVTYGNKQHHHIMIKDSIYQADAKILPSDISPDERVSKHKKQKLTNSLLIEGDFKSNSLEPIGKK